MSDDNEPGRDPAALSVRQHIESLVKMMAVVAPALSQALMGAPLLMQAVFGTLDERRANRVAATLKEVETRLSKIERRSYVECEEFQSLLETVVPLLARATNEDKRQRLRDLVFNSALVPPGHSDWGEAELAARIVSEIDGPGLAIIAAIGLLPSEAVTMWSLPSPAMFQGDHNFRAEQGGVLVPPDDLPRVHLNYAWDVLVEWMIRLGNSGLRVCQSRWGDAGGRGDGTTVGYGLEVRPLGRLLVRWILASEETMTTRG
jgi:hypothetical protein